MYNKRGWTLTEVKFIFYICDNLFHWVVRIDKKTCKMVNTLNGSVSKVTVQDNSKNCYYN